MSIDSIVDFGALDAIDAPDSFRNWMDFKIFANWPMASFLTSTQVRQGGNSFFVFFEHSLYLFSWRKIDIWVRAVWQVGDGMFLGDSRSLHTKLAEVT